MAITLASSSSIMHPAIRSVRLKLAFYMTCVVLILVQHKGQASETQESLVRAKRDSQEEGKATVTLREGETTQKRSLTSIEERQSGSRVISTDNTHKPGGGMLLDCSRSHVWRIQEGMSSTYTTKQCTRGVVVHMLKVPIACTKGAMIHK